jgi:hypothetical protein
MFYIYSMNSYRTISAEADLPPLDPKGDPNGDRAALGSGRDDADNPAWLKRRAALLERLAERGVDLAEELPALAKAQSRLAEAVTECLHKATPEGRAALGELAVTLHQGNVDFALMYERISRSVRRCIAMREQVPPLRASAAAARGAAGAAAPRSKATGKPAVDAPRDPEVEAEKDMAAGRTGEVDAEDLFGDLYDRPEDPTGMADLGLDRPLAELVAEICADFGVDGRVWAERLGVGDETTEAPATGKTRSAAGGGRVNGAKPPETPNAPSTAPRETSRSVRPPPHRPATDSPADHGDSVGDGMSGLNRRQRRAAHKLARRSLPANRRHRDGGRHPP